MSNAAKVRSAEETTYILTVDAVARNGGRATTAAITHLPRQTPAGIISERGSFSRLFPAFRQLFGDV